MTSIPVRSEAFLGALCLALVQAQDRPSHPAADPVQDLLRTLEQQTELATRTRLNVDKVPGGMTIVSGREMQAKGARRVAEALELLRSVQVSAVGTGRSQVIVRGLGKVVRSGKSKLLLNGVPAHGELLGDFGFLLALPLEQVERIEVIRGPGSAIHGEFAFAGVINIVTRNRGAEATVRVDENGGLTPALVLSHKTAREVTIGVNVAGFHTGGGEVRSGPDRLYGTANQAVSNAPGPSNEKDRSLAAILSLDRKALHVEFQLARRSTGDRFGISDFLPEPDASAGIDEGRWALAAAERWKLSQDWSVAVHAATMQYHTAADVMWAPRGYRSGSTVYPDGQYGGLFYTEQQATGDAEAEYRGWKRQRVLVGVAAAKLFVTDQFQRFNYDPTTLLPLPGQTDFRGAQGFLREGDVGRRLVSVYLQDEIGCTPELMLIAGARLDDYGRLGRQVSPRIAAAYSVTSRHALKAEYAEAFRPPTVAELYSQLAASIGNPSLRPETIRTAEFGYVYTGPSLVARAAVFFSRISDQIVVIQNHFANQGRARVSGWGLEAAKELGRYWKLDGTLSFGAPESVETGRPFEDISRWTGNAGLRFAPRPSWNYSLEYRFRGPMERAAADVRDPLNQQHLVDVTVDLPGILRQGVGVRAGVRDILNRGLRLPAAPGTYADDYPRPGREVWVALNYVW